MTRFSRFALIASALLAAFALFFFAGFRYGEPTWLLRSGITIVAVCFSLTLALALGLYGLSVLQGTNAYAARISTIVLALTLVTALIALSYAAGAEVSRIVLAYETVLLFGILILNTQKLKHEWLKSFVNFVVFAVAIAPSLTASSLSSFRELVLGDRGVGFNASIEYLISSRHDLKVTTLPLFNARLEQNGGGFIPLGQDRYLIGVGSGDFLDVSIGENGVSVLPTTIKAPLNRAQYLQEAEYPTPYFRVTDVFLEPSAGPRRRLLASHHYWNSEQRCITLRLSEATIDVTNLDGSTQEWKTRFESTPCISISNLTNRNGGRIALRSPNSILMSVGTQGYERAVSDLSDLDSSSYGKIFEIDMNDWSSRVFTSGHRNPQGLLITEEAIWSTEHGPQGGDELNLLVEGENYGWPRSTYGTEYAQKEWPMIVGPEDHSYGRQPIYAWIPSIGISQLLQVTGRAFSSWQDDLIISSLNGAGGPDTGSSLYRVKIQEGRAVLVERLLTGRRVRDLAERDDGTLVLWDGDYSLQIVEPAAHVFASCSGCHVIRNRLTHGLGPDLLGITEDRVARRANFTYSEALRNFGGRWTTERLDAFLRDPSGVVPGTTMVFAGIEDENLRAEIIEYLAKLGR